MLRLRQSISVLATITIGVAASLLLLVPTASALSTKYFDDVSANCDIQGCNNTQIDLAVGQSSNVQKSSVNLTAYFKSPNGTISIDGAHYCPGEPGNHDSLLDTDHYGTANLPSDTPVTTYRIVYGTTIKLVTGNKYVGTDPRCDAPIIVNLTGMTLDTQLGLYYATFSANSIDNWAGPDGKNTCQAGDYSGCDGLFNKFSVRETAGSTNVIAQKGGSTGYEVTARQGGGSSENNTYYVKFGADCSVKAGGSPASLYYYDMDNGGGGGSQVNGNITMSLLDGAGNKVIPDWTPPNGNGVTGSQPFTAQPGTSYTWEIHNVYQANTIQFSTPYDGIYFLKPCSPPPTPTPAPTPPPPPPHAYFKATGGDVVAGASIAASGGTPCSNVPPINTKAGIVSWNLDGKPSYAGAGGAYAAFAVNYIQDFVTGQGNGVANGVAASELAFANQNYPSGTQKSVDPNSGLFGGMFDASPCVDYWTARPATLTTLPTGPISGWANGVYSVNSNVTLNASTVPSGKQITLYVDGNVAITGNVTYPAATYATRADIPSFKLIAHGVVYIDKSVTALDGLYAAIPNSDYATTTTKQNFSAPKPGTISTCSTGFASYDPTQILTTYPNMAADCAKQLVVTGSVAANQVWLLRDYGDVNGQPAETFNYSPEMWLAPSSGAGTNTGSQPYQSIIGLPPIL